ncbi:cytochrome d ubiquinol oxidase subunit II [Agromyces protaetiae]|uniref:Cytochrome d ubiquinol oxidase subunit II n=1 Tax=Agromyces protaetiae TaxID=2509455 RepID=A0A4P6FED3_9MICO|nr:cytochrome d ubiquinol oxidase subunit II [Agromyces protaetiae]QAY74156.1 cytochrome d ubiquinol oxidase subunit II [Agromyces protaetiae]
MDLAVLWFWIVAVLFVGYFVLDGFDFGVGMSLPFLGKDDTDRRVLINTIGPVWDLNETWVIVAGASLFAAFPEWYASLFSGFYLALLLILLALIARGVSFEYRHQRPEAAWKARFDWMIVIGSAVPALLWGVAFANIVQGVPLDEGHNFTGNLLTLLNPYALLGGVTTLLVFFVHGVVFVSLKTEGDLRVRAQRLATRAGVVTIVVAAAFLVWTGLAYGSVWFWILAAVAAVALIGGWLANTRGREGVAFTLLAVTIASTVLALFASLFPDVLPASNDPANSLTIENASSTPYTLEFMTWVAGVALPLVLLYQGWTYWIFRKRVKRSTIEQAAH